MSLISSHVAHLYPAPGPLSPGLRYIVVCILIFQRGKFSEQITSNSLKGIWLFFF